MSDQDASAMDTATHTAATPPVLLDHTLKAERLAPHLRE